MERVSARLETYKELAHVLRQESVQSERYVRDRQRGDAGDAKSAQVRPMSAPDDEGEELYLEEYGRLAGRAVGRVEMQRARPPVADSASVRAGDAGLLSYLPGGGRGGRRSGVIQMEPFSSPAKHELDGGEMGSSATEASAGQHGNANEDMGVDEEGDEGGCRDEEEEGEGRVEADDAACDYGDAPLLSAEESLEGLQEELSLQRRLMALQSGAYERQVAMARRAAEEEEREAEERHGRAMGELHSKVAALQRMAASVSATTATTSATGAAGSAAAGRIPALPRPPPTPAPSTSERAAAAVAAGECAARSAALARLASLKAALSAETRGLALELARQSSLVAALQGELGQAAERAAAAAVAAQAEEEVLERGIARWRQVRARRMEVPWAVERARRVGQAPREALADWLRGKVEGKREAVMGRVEEARASLASLHRQVACRHGVILALAELAVTRCGGSEGDGGGREGGSGGDDGRPHNGHSPANDGDGEARQGGARGVEESSSAGVKPGSGQLSCSGSSWGSDGMRAVAVAAARRHGGAGAGLQAALGELRRQAGRAISDLLGCEDGGRQRGKGGSEQWQKGRTGPPTSKSVCHELEGEMVVEVRRRLRVAVEQRADRVVDGPQGSCVAACLPVSTPRRTAPSPPPRTHRHTHAHTHTHSHSHPAHSAVVHPLPATTPPMPDTRPPEQGKALDGASGDPSTTSEHSAATTASASHAADDDGGGAAAAAAPADAARAAVPSPEASTRTCAPPGGVSAVSAEEPREPEGRSGTGGGQGDAASREQVASEGEGGRRRTISRSLFGDMGGERVPSRTCSEMEAALRSRALDGLQHGACASHVTAAGEAACVGGAAVKKNVGGSAGCSQDTVAGRHDGLELGAVRASRSKNNTIGLR